ncbi:MAG TPA: DUF202 domain-containing protein [Thermoanaerobaculia bacterium]|nr:DUF202 domain-containing protein [Thermoanaerobaculia bacterium]
MTDLTDPRILFAAERTLLAWIRTGLAIMGGGFAVIHIGMTLWGGVILIVIGAAMNLIGAFEYAEISRRLRAGDQRVPARPIQMATGVAVLIALGGIAGIVYLLSR